MSAQFLDTFRGRLRLEGVLTTATALHIGAGGTGDALGTDSPVVRTAAGEPYIPGSSLKGVLRSAAEALFRGGPGQSEKHDLWACDTFGDEACGSHKKVQEIRAREEKQASDERRPVDERRILEDIWAESCAVCRLFGSLALASRARFADLPVRGEAPLLDLRNGVGIDRDKELAASGVLYDFEAVPPGTQFDLRVIVDNSTDAEAGLLLYLFTELGSGNLALGGKTSRGLGRVRIDWERIEEITLAKDNPFASLLSSRDLLAGPTGETAPQEAGQDDLATRLPASGDPAAWRTVAEILRGLPAIEKGPLGERAKERDLHKGNISQILGLGLDEKQSRKAWDVALDRLVKSGFLSKEGDAFSIAGRKPAQAAPETPSHPRDACLQDVLDRYVGAMANLWQEAS